MSIARKDKKLPAVKIEEVKAHLKRMWVLLGLNLSNYPEQVEFDYLSAKYREIYARYSIRDIELAVDLALNGSIDQKLNLYDKPFSPAFFSPLMIKFTEYRRQESRQQSAINEEEKTAFEIWEIKADAVLNLWDKFAAGLTDIADFNWFNYNFLSHTCKILQPSKEQIQAAEIKAKSLLDIEVEAINRHRKNMFIRTIREAAGTNSIKDKAKEIILFNYFTELQAMDGRLQDYIPENPNLEKKIECLLKK